MSWWAYSGHMAWTEKRSGKYLVRWREPGGKVVSRTFHRSEEARSFRREIERALDRKEYVPVEVRNAPFHDYFEGVIDGALNLRPSTRYKYGLVADKHILPRLGPLPVGSLDESTLRRFFAALQEEGAGVPTLASTRRVLSRVLTQAVREGILTRNPLDGIPAPHEPRPEMRILDPEEVRLLADAVAPRFRAMTLLAAFSGLRIGELGALRVDRLNVFSRRLEVTQAVQTAGGQATIGPPKSKAGRRVVAIPSFVAEALVAHIAEFPPTEDGRVFSLEGGGLVSHQTFWWHWRRACEATGIRARFHDLRHTAVALAIQQGAHPKQIQTRMGHANIQMTLDRYGHLFPGMDEDLATKMDAAYGKEEEWSR